MINDKSNPQRNWSLKLGQMQTASTLTIPCKAPSLEPQDRPEIKRSLEITNEYFKSGHVLGSLSEETSSNRLARAADFAKSLFLFQPLGPSLDEGSLEEIVVHRSKENPYQMFSQADKTLQTAAPQVWDA